MNAVPRRRVLTIAGSDSGGGAGIQADLKTFSAFGVHGMTAITAVTAQNTLHVQGVHTLPPDFVVSQIEAVLSDIGADALKTGMLSNAQIIHAVCDCLRIYRPPHLVVDPVMVATSGDRLLEEGAIEGLIKRLFPLAEIVTPNLFEAECLTGIRIRRAQDFPEVAKRIHALGPRNVLIKGGHGEGNEAIDYLFDGSELRLFPSPRVQVGSLHGAGCTLSAAIAANLALGVELAASVNLAKAFVTRAIELGAQLGRGHRILDAVAVPRSVGDPQDETGPQGK